MSLGILTCASSFAAEEKESQTIKVGTSIANVEIVKKDNFIKSKYASAENRFLQGNIKASYDDYADLISIANHDDYVFLAYAIKLAEYGFFDLSERLFENLDNNLYTQNYIHDIKLFYYPQCNMDFKDTVALADAYASIVYNNLAIETTTELLNNTKISESDYKNYLVALGFYKSNNLQQALKYINNAILANDKNINYKILKAKILADTNKTKQALKILKEIKKAEFLTVDFQEKIKAIEEYILYKVAKEEPLKDYHLAYYYHLQNKTSLAIKVLQSSILQAKQYSSNIFGLLGKVYYEIDEPLKAQEFAQRAYKENKKNYHANLTLANLNYDARNYQEALEYFKEANKLTEDCSAKLGVAKSYIALSKEKKSKKIYENMLKKDLNNSELLVGTLKIFPQRADEYLPLLVASDITNNDIWLALTNLAIQDNNYTMAETYLNNSYYIDGNNFKYYYYLSLLLKARGEVEKSNISLIKCSKLNSEYKTNLNLELDKYEE
ncbi:hypothetical protein IJ384_01345 [bacterium]|nr:hypothetical protein [bacterium]